MKMLIIFDGNVIKVVKKSELNVPSLTALFWDLNECMGLRSRFDSPIAWTEELSFRPAQISG